MIVTPASACNPVAPRRGAPGRLALVLLANMGCADHSDDEPRETSEFLFAIPHCDEVRGDACRGGATACLAKGVSLGVEPQVEPTFADCSILLGNGLSITGNQCDILVGAQCARADALPVRVRLRSAELVAACASYQMLSRDLIPEGCFRGGIASSEECDVLTGAFGRLRECFEERGPQAFPDGECFQIFRAAFWTAEDATQECEVCPWWSSKECFEAAAGLSVGTGG
jgi:hypothetical protein